MATWENSRLTVSSAVSDTPSALVALESAIKLVLGIGALEEGVTLTGAIANFAVDGSFIDFLKAKANPGAAGYRCRDDVNGDEWALVANNGFLQILRNDGDFATPSWTVVNTLDLSDGSWGVGGGGGGTGTFVGFTGTSAVAVSYGTGSPFQTWTELLDPQSFRDPSDPSKMVVRAGYAGKYHFDFHASPGAAAAISPYDLQIVVYKNGALYRSFRTAAPAGRSPHVCGHAVASLVEGDYIQVYAFNDYATSDSISLHFSMVLDSA